mmetsp:Transcript_50057/g.150625  ORF Transcript_50057/g.150625 Transcript_50057/m.150625 type:complete len:210 (-) Transcript_50057:685-1314(-)
MTVSDDRHDRFGPFGQPSFECGDSVGKGVVMGGTREPFEGCAFREGRVFDDGMDFSREVRGLRGGGFGCSLLGSVAIAVIVEFALFVLERRRAVASIVLAVFHVSIDCGALGLCSCCRRSALTFSTRVILSGSSPFVAFRFRLVVFIVELQQAIAPLHCLGFAVVVGRERGAGGADQIVESSQGRHLGRGCCRARSRRSGSRGTSLRLV